MVNTGRSLVRTLLLHLLRGHCLGDFLDVGDHGLEPRDDDDGLVVVDHVEGGTNLVELSVLHHSVLENRALNRFFQLCYIPLLFDILQHAEVCFKRALHSFLFKVFHVEADFLDLLEFEAVVAAGGAGRADDGESLQLLLPVGQALQLFYREWTRFRLSRIVWRLRLVFCALHFHLLKVVLFLDESHKVVQT